MGEAAFKILRNRPHLSYSQINTYLNCSLKYYFQYVAGLPKERISVALPFGRSMHAAFERQYKHLQSEHVPESLEVLREFFSDHLVTTLSLIDEEIIFKKETADIDSALSMGQNLLTVFHRHSSQVDPESIVGVEMPLSCSLGDELNLDLVGIIDLLLEDEQGNLIVVDNKTSKMPYNQTNVDQDLQMSCYGVLLEDSEQINRSDNLSCRFDVLRKLKTPTMESYSTVRTPLDRMRFHKIAAKVIEGIDQELFIPNRSWMCGDCPYSDACQNW